MKVVGHETIRINFNSFELIVHKLIDDLILSIDWLPEKIGKLIQRIVKAIEVYSLKCSRVVELMSKDFFSLKSPINNVVGVVSDNWYFTIWHMLLTPRGGITERVTPRGVI